MDEFSQGVEALRLFLLPFMLGSVAAIMRLCKYGWRGFWHHFREFILCGIYGAMISAVIDLYDLPVTAKYSIACACSYAMLELGDTIFAKLKDMIQSLSLRDLFPGWFGKRPGISRDLGREDRKDED